MNRGLWIWFLFIFLSIESKALDRRLDSLNQEIASSQDLGIKMNETQIKKLGIQTVRITEGGKTKSIPFNAILDFDPTTSTTQSSTFDAIVVSLHRREGQMVKKGEVICEISSVDLDNLFFEFQNAMNRYSIAKEIADKDKQLYESGIISQREYQVSYLNANELFLKLRQIRSTFNTFGIDLSHPKGDRGFRIVANKDGLLAVSPKQIGERIHSFTPYIRITDGVDLLAYIRVPVNMVGYVKPRSRVYDGMGRNIGHVQSVSVVIDKLTNTVLATAKIIQGSFKVGEVIELYVEGEVERDSMVVPAEAIIKNENDYLLFKRIQGGFEPIKVSVLEEKNHAFIIQASSSIHVGDEVAVGSIIALKGILNNIGQ